MTGTESMSTGRKATHACVHKVGAPKGSHRGSARGGKRIREERKESPWLDGPIAGQQHWSRTSSRTCWVRCNEPALRSTAQRSPPCRLSNGIPSGTRSVISSGMLSLISSGVPSAIPISFPSHQPSYHGLT